MRIWLVSICFLLQGSYIHTHPFVISGKVLDGEGNPVVSATVREKRSMLATTTDSKGAFKIILSNSPAVLVFSAVGYTTKELTVHDRDSSKKLKIRLEGRSDGLSEVVVVTGYATKTDGRGAETKAMTIRRAPSILSGKTSGISIQPGMDASLSSILTAGELNDFKKWKLWGDYSADEFSSFSHQWQLYLRKRFSVQVQSKDQRMLSGKKVFLINRDTRDTAWKAVTDNTGKAELWGDFTRDENEHSPYSIYCEGEMISNAIAFENGINAIRLKTPCVNSSQVDIAFVIDATGSMGDEISYLQAELEDIMRKVANDHKKVQFRLGSVFYRDHGDEYLTRSIDFTGDLDQFNAFLGNQAAGGGGDYPEAVEDALDAALHNMNWSRDARSKILFLVLDAPPHDAAKQKMQKLILQAASMGIRIVPIGCSGINKSTEYLLRSMALATNGSYVFLTDDSGVGNPHIKPTTDEFKVELLNELLHRIIGEMIYIPPCNNKTSDPVIKDTFSVTAVKLYPNPTSGKVVLESGEALKEIYLTDFAGKILFRVDAGSRQRKWTVYLNRYPSGTYMIRYLVDNKGWGAEKIVLIH